MADLCYGRRRKGFRLCDLREFYDLCEWSFEKLLISLSFSQAGLRTRGLADASPSAIPANTTGGRSGNSATSERGKQKVAALFQPTHTVLSD
jgi:hypothetical protein